MAGPATNGGWLARLVERALGADQIYWLRALLLLAFLAIGYLVIGAPGTPMARHAAQLEAVQGAILEIAAGSKADIRFQYVECWRRESTVAGRRNCRAIREGREPDLDGDHAGGPR